MKSVRQEIGGLGNLLFKEAFIYGQMLDGKIPDIYLQSSKYWTQHKDKIRQRFGNGIGRIDKIAVHIRRGDYLKASQFHTNLWDTSYYHEAFKLFPNEKFLVFCKDTQNPEMDTADKEWCVENLTPILGEDFEMYTHGEETDDLNAMASCKGLIGANSSFSWWAAFLGNHEKVVFPTEEKWFTDGVVRTDLPDGVLRL